MTLANHIFKLADVLNNPPIPLFSSNARRQPTEETVVDPREIDKVLSEVAAMIGRWHLFKKFLSEALKVLTFKVFKSCLLTSFTMPGRYN